MTKRVFSVLLAVFMICCCVLPAFARSELGTVRVKLNSDVAGYTENDVAQFIEIQSDNVVSGRRDGGPVFVADYSGTPEFGALVAGRTYFIDYALVAAEGFVLPDKLEDGDVEIKCGKGISVYHTAIVSGPYRDEAGEMHDYKGLRIQAKVVVDGNVFQRVIGVIHDVILKIRAWSLY